MTLEQIATLAAFGESETIEFKETKELFISARVTAIVVLALLMASVLECPT